MNTVRSRRAFRARVMYVVLATLALVLLTLLVPTTADARGTLSSGAAMCDEIKVDEGNKESFHAYATGVQIYRWNGSSWSFVGPSAMLYADAQGQGVVGMHFSGPRWMSASGSVVKAAKVSECTPDANAIAWLKLRGVESTGPGIFEGTTFIQRVNTTGGMIPTEPGTTLNEERHVPYTAEYIFFRAQ